MSMRFGQCVTLGLGSSPVQTVRVLQPRPVTSEYFGPAIVREDSGDAAVRTSDSELCDGPKTIIVVWTVVFALSSPIDVCVFRALDRIGSTP